MKLKSRVALKPRKMPVQARSGGTVDAILQAAIHILLRQGFDRLTTTRVAERAGVSVGSLYQYFPNKNALIAVILQRHLDEVASAVEEVCRSKQGTTVSEMIQAACSAFIEAKTRRLDVSLALYRISAELGVRQMVRSAGERSQAALIGMLRTASDRVFPDLRLPAMILTTAMVGPVQTMMEMGATPAMFAALKLQLIDLCTAYLYQVAIA